MAPRGHSAKDVRAALDSTIKLCFFCRSQWRWRMRQACAACLPMGRRAPRFIRLVSCAAARPATGCGVACDRRAAETDPARDRRDSSPRRPTRRSATSSSGLITGARRRELQQAVTRPVCEQEGSERIWLETDDVRADLPEPVGAQARADRIEVDDHTRRVRVEKGFEHDGG